MNPRRDDDREPCGDHRAEGDQQDQQCRTHADQLDGAGLGRRREVHDETRLDGRHKPVLEVRLRQDELERERQDAIRFANESLLETLVPVLDNFEMAIQAANDPKGGALEALKTGVNMIYQQLRNVLVEAGLEEIDATGKQFDPNLHEAISQQETAEAPAGQVVQQVRKGFKLRERLLRPASVVVAKHPAA